MKRRDFIKTLSATGMAVCSPMALTPRAYAESVPVDRYFVFLHLGGGWDPTSLCNPKGNRLRNTIDINAREGASPVNRFSDGAIRRAVDVAIEAGIDEDMRYAPFVGTFNREDQGNDNSGLSIEMIQRMLSGTVVGDVLSANTAAGFSWAAAKADSAAAIRGNAAAILEGTVDTINFGTLVADNADLFDGLVRNGTNMAANLFVYDAFYCLYSQHVRVLNGVDNRTNGHDTGTRFADTGSMDPSYPDFSALYAAAKGAEMPLAYITDGGGNNETAGLVARSSASDVGVFNVLANPEGNYLRNGLDSLIEQAKDQRREVLAEKESLPRRVRLKSQLYMVRDEGVAFSGVAAELATPPDGTAARVLDDEARNNNNNRQRQMRIGAAAMNAGMASSMQIGFGGFDTHNNHDNSHFQRIRTVLVDLHYLWRALDVYSIRDKTTIVLGSDFGRTPWFNGGEGKDHWAVTSYMLLGRDVVGGSVVNATDALVGPRNVQLQGGRLVPTTSNSNGIRMTPAHLHRQLRAAGSIENHAFSQRFPIEVDADLPMLG
ncbi:DUF1501 domain-containing protein [Saccharospirillum impatiens]|uniref:DUF1501 domain-containing protein n=1 Tax=Saccharospirillum impatiens TaxID=169438 RepID=UPI0004039B45|nr:DUF1501 domain-containing protein [Saccharospirillum impatiens]